MKTYILGATAVCYLEIRHDNVLYTPSTSIQATIYKPDGTAEAIASMTAESTGIYSYDYQTAGKPCGEYKVLYTVTDGTKITPDKDYFKVEPI